MKLVLVTLSAASLLGGCTAASQRSDAAGATATTAQGNNGMTNGSDPGRPPAERRTPTPPPKDVQPSPWQPPAEVDPVLPPVEGGETKEPSGPGNG
jgi:hypothetical protein